MSQLFTKMLEAQKEIKHAIKDAKNPHLKNRYASLNAVLDEVKPILNKNGLVLSQHALPGAPGWVVVQTRITDSETGDYTADQLPVPVKHKFKDGVDIGPDAQELGSAITYGRRYGLLAMCAIASEDDDAELAVNGPSSAPAKPTAGVVRGGSAGAPAAGAPKVEVTKFEKPSEEKISKEEADKLQSSLANKLNWKKV